jgi:hypothetical protein
MGLPVGNLSQGKFAICTASLSNAYRVWPDQLPGVIGYGAPGFLSQPEYDIYSDGKMLSESSARHDQQPRLPIAQGGQKKVKCTWPGCLRSVQKNNLTRHVNEMHRRVVKAVCDGCGRGFMRSYMLKNHTCPAKYKKS